MKILYFTKGGRDVGSSNERVWIVADRLVCEHGFYCEVISARENSLGKFLWALLFSSYDILVIHKSLFTAGTFFATVIAKIIFRTPMIYDLDDAEWLHSPIKSKIFARLANTIFVGSHAIEEWALHLNKKVIFMPTSVDSKLFSPHVAQSGVDTKELVIGWAGSAREHFKRGNFTIIRGALTELARRGLRFQLHLVGAQGYQPVEEYMSSSHYELKLYPRVPMSELPQMLCRFDIGLAPLVDASFERAKCAAKIIQYMACGVSVVASPVGENAVVVENGINGFLARSEGEWVDALVRLAKDLGLRRALGEKGREKVVHAYSYQVNIPRYMRALEELLAR